MHDLVCDDSWVLEDDRPDRRVATPLPETFASIARLAEGIERGGPGGISSVALVDGGESILRGTVRTGGVGCKWLGAGDTKSTGNGSAKMVFLEGDGLTRAIQHAPKAIELLSHGVPPVAGNFQFVPPGLAAV